MVEVGVVLTSDEQFANYTIARWTTQAPMDKTTYSKAYARRALDDMALEVYKMPFIVTPVGPKAC